MARRRAIPEGIRVTKVGVWYIGLTLLVGVAAANTGNNALYLVEVVLLGLFVASGVFSRRNLKHLAVEVIGPGEIHAGTPFYLDVEVENRDRWLGRSLMLVSTELTDEPTLIERMARRGVWTGRLTAVAPKRGVHPVRWLHFWSIYPLGFMRKGMRYAVDLDLLVFPQLLTSDAVSEARQGEAGHDASNRRGQGHELFGLRHFRPGDDPRSIHWKQTARTGQFVFTEREAEEGQRLSILFDNAVGQPVTPADDEAFERLVSEAATAADDYLRAGYEVELVGRDFAVPFGQGAGHRYRLLENLALSEPVGATAAPLQASDARAATVRVGYRERMAV